MSSYKDIDFEKRFRYSIEGVREMYEEVKRITQIIIEAEDPTSIAEMVKRTDYLRHEMFAVEMCEANGFKYYGDTEISTFLVEHFSEDQGMLNRLLKKSTFIDKDKKYKTPDMLMMSSDSTQLYVIDFCCRARTDVAFGEKKEKYEYVISSLKDVLGVEICIINFNTKNDSIDISSNSEFIKTMFSQHVFSYRNFVLQLEELKKRKVNEFNPEGKEMYERMMNSKDKDIHSLATKVNLSFGMKSNELRKFLEIYDDTVKEIENDMGSGFIRDNLEAIEKTSFDSDEKDRNEEWERQRKELEDFVNLKAKEDIKQDTRLERPTVEIIKNAYKRMEDKASEHFSFIGEAKMLNFLPVVSSDFVDKTDEEESAKYKRLKRFSELIQSCKGKFISNFKEVFVHDKVRYEEILDSIEESKPIKITDSEFVTFCANDGMKIKVGDRSKIKELELGCGYGLKYTKESSRDGKEKVESLKFWDESDLEEGCKSFKEKALALSSILIKIGSKRSKDSEFLKSYCENMEKNKGAPENFDVELSNDDELDLEEMSDEEKEGMIPSFLKPSGFLKKIKGLKRALERNESEESKKSLKFSYTDVKDSISGALQLLREYEVLSENLLNCTAKSCREIKIVQGLNSNQLIVVMPHESILMSTSELSCYTVTMYNMLKSDYLDLDCELAWEQVGDNVLTISKGYKLKKSRIANLNQCSSKFISMLESYNALLQDNGLRDANPYVIAKMFLLTVNVNINTSAMFDNIRYMVDNSFADMSCCSEYIEDKLLVPCKNNLQLYFYRETKQLMSVLNKSVEKAEIKDREIEDEDEVDISLSKLRGAKIRSVIDKNVVYKNLSSLIQEIQILFFSTPKGLHGKFHNAIKVHRTPLDIQLDINDYKESFGNGSMNLDRGGFHRVAFSPRMMVLASHLAENKCLKSPSSMRVMMENEGFNESPLKIKTMTSTRSILVKRPVKRYYDGPVNNFEVKGTGWSLRKEVIVGWSRRVECEKNVNSAKKYLKIAKARAFLEAKKFLKKREDLNKASNIIYSFKVNSNKRLVQIEGDRENKMEKLRLHGVREFWASGVVLTETIKKCKDDEGEKTLGEYAKEALFREQEFMAAVREKGQRTKDDREIFVVNREMKESVYVIEHVFKRFSQQVRNEKISIPGDEKIIDLYSQVKQMAKFEIDEKRKGKKVFVFNFNLDMTKWAPKDNLLKFIPFICNFSFLKREEKYTMLAIMIKYYRKELYISEDIISNMIKGMEKGRDFSESCFYKMLYKEGEWDNKVRIKETWLQGQLNYPSSVVHSSMMYLLEEIIRKRYENCNMIFLSNVHSDDGQTSIGLSFDEGAIGDYDTVARDIWSMLLDISKNFCIELSIKKSNISRYIKQFVSQYNIGDEQVYIWVKQIMSCVSGLPYMDFKGDITSILSKVSEAASKGAPERVCRSVTRSLIDYVQRVYGVRRKNKNVFSETLGISEKYLPLCLGGGKDVNMELLAYLGPQFCDIDTIERILKKWRSNSIHEPSKMPTSGEELRALKLFIVCEKLSNLIYEDDANESSDNKFNIFRPIRYKSASKEINDPFRIWTKQERVNMAEKSKVERPSILMIKPKEVDEILEFYNILYLNPTFQAAMSGQSPNQLLAYRICCRQKGNFRFLKDGDITEMIDVKCKEDNDRKVFNAEEVAKILKEMVDSIELSLPLCQSLWKRYIDDNVEYQILKHTIDTAERGIISKRRNPVPFKKPRGYERTTILNPISLLLMRLFDEKNFDKDEKDLKYPGNAHLDLVKLADSYPEMFLFLKAKSEENPSNYTNFRSDLTKLRESDLLIVRTRVSDLIKDEMVNQGVLNDLMAKVMDSDDKAERVRRMRELLTAYRERLGDSIKNKNRIDRKISEDSERLIEPKFRDVNERNKLERIISKVTEKIESLKERISQTEGEIEPAGLDDVKLAREEKVDHGLLIANRFEERLPENLLKISRGLLESRKKVIFSSPTKTRDPSEVILGLKSQIEGSNSFMIEYSISVETTKYLDKRIRKGLTSEIEEMDRFCLILNNVMITTLRIYPEETSVSKILLSLQYKGYNISDILKNKMKLSRRSRRCLIMPCLILKRREDAIFLIESLDSASIHWVKAESGPEGEFKAYALGFGMSLIIEGMNKKITSMEARTTERDVKMMSVKMDILLKKFINDLNSGKQNYGQKVELKSALNLIPAHKKQKHMVNIMSNRITDVYKEGETFGIKGYKGENLYQGHGTLHAVSDPEADLIEMRFSYMRMEKTHYEAIPLPFVTSYTADVSFRAGVTVLGIPIDKKDLFLNGISLPKVFDTGLWRQIAVDKGKNVSCSQISKVTEVPGMIMISRGPVHTRSLFDRITGLETCEMNEDDAYYFCRDIMEKKGGAYDSNLRDFRESEEASLQMMERSRSRRSDNPILRASIATINNEPVLIDKFDLLDMVQSPVAEDDYIVSVADKDLIGVDKLVNNCKPVVMSCEEMDMLSMMAVCLGCYSAMINPRERISVMQGDFSGVVKGMGDIRMTQMLKTLEYFLMHCPLLAYLVTMETDMPEKKEEVDDYYKLLKQHILDKRHQIRSEFAALIIFVDNMKSKIDQRRDRRNDSEIKKKLGLRTVDFDGRSKKDTYSKGRRVDKIAEKRLEGMSLKERIEMEERMTSMTETEAGSGLEDVYEGKVSRKIREKTKVFKGGKKVVYGSGASGKIKEVLSGGIENWRERGPKRESWRERTKGRKDYRISEHKSYNEVDESGGYSTEDLEYRKLWSQEEKKKKEFEQKREGMSEIHRGAAVEYSLRRSEEKGEISKKAETEVSPGTLSILSMAPKMSETLKKNMDIDELGEFVQEGEVEVGLSDLDGFSEDE